MKLKIVTVVLIITVLALGGYRLAVYMNKDSGTTNDVTTPVRVVEIREETMDDVLDYQGRIAPVSMGKISFKSTGRLAEINGQIGDVIEIGAVLAKLDTSDLQHALDAAESQQMAAKANYERVLKGARAEDVSLASISVQKASKAVDYLKNKVTDIIALYEEGVVSLSELEGIELELTLAESDRALAQKNYDKARGGAEAEVIEVALAQYELAVINKATQLSLMEDATYTLKAPSILILKLYEPGELVPAGYPVAVLRSIEQKVIIGVAGKDLNQVKIGQAVTILTKNNSGRGLIQRIAEIPDDNHFLYEVEVELDANHYIVGEIAACQLLLGKRQVVRIPVTAILNDGIDYVFVADEGIATVRQVVIEDVVNGNAVVSGLNVGDQMIVSNLNRIHEQSKVHIEE